MSVIMCLQVKADPKAVERLFDGEGSHAILEAAKKHGLIAHRFYGSDNGGNVMVLDEWPDPDSFRAFFEEQGQEIGRMFQEAGVSSEPQPTFWRELATGDAFGWGA